MMWSPPPDPKGTRAPAFGPLACSMMTTMVMLTSLLAILGEFA